MEDDPLSSEQDRQQHGNVWSLKTTVIQTLGSFVRHVELAICAHTLGDLDGALVVKANAKRDGIAVSMR